MSYIWLRENGFDIFVGGIILFRVAREICCEKASIVMCYSSSSHASSCTQLFHFGRPGDSSAIGESGIVPPFCIHM
jgi:hypothetical protein